MEDLKVLICRWLHLTYLETHALSVLRLPFKDHDMSSQTMLNRITSNYLEDPSPRIFSQTSLSSRFSGFHRFPPFPAEHTPHWPMLELLFISIIVAWQHE